jgi:hypothetical protein
MKLIKSNDHDPNYLAEIITIPAISPHPNADRLELTEVFGNTVVLGKGLYKEGEKVIYFPVESCLSAEFLSWANLFDKPELNADGETKGFFSNKGCRVKAVKLREIPSQGFLFKVSKLAEYYKTSESDFKVGTSFDTVGDNLLVKKYVRPTSNSHENIKKSKVPNWINKTVGYLPRPVRRIVFIPIQKYYGVDKCNGIKSLIVDGQFKFHYKTEHMGKNAWLLKPDDVISVTEKLHGTSAIFANILCKKPQNFIQRIFGADSKETAYKLVYSSRSVLKNRKDGKFTDDVWGKHAEEIDGKIPAGYAIFGEIIGWVSSGKQVQKNYDYGVTRGESELVVYRVTETNEQGEARELSWDEIESFCKSCNLNTVPVHYSGRAGDLFNIPEDEQWAENFLIELKKKHLDKKCELCTTGVINEGVVVKINNSKLKPAFKFKSPLFVVKESASRDSGEADMEEES